MNDSHGHDHPHEHDHPHDHDHGHRGLRSRLAHAFKPHSHDAKDSIDSALEASADGIRAVKRSFVALMITTLIQIVIVYFSNSVALLADTIHNFADALTAVPLGIAFLIGRRAANRRYTYGYGRAEDLAGLFVVLVIAISAVVAGATAIDRLFHPADVQNIGWLVVAGLVGCAGNELVAQYRIRVGRRIGSAALVADGLHARTDGLTSLAVVLGAIGVAAGWQEADPVIGLAITVAILFVLRDAARDVYRRLMDSVDPELVDAVEGVVKTIPEVLVVDSVRVRWIGHELRAEIEITCAASLSLRAAHEIGEHATRHLLREVPRLTSAIIHVSPEGEDVHRPYAVGGTHTHTHNH
jgi:cation diffusion facilitator family transporter